MVTSGGFVHHIFWSQGISSGLVDGGALFRNEEIEGYIFLRYVNVIEGRLPRGVYGP